MGWFASDSDEFLTATVYIRSRAPLQRHDARSVIERAAAYYSRASAS